MNPKQKFEKDYPEYRQPKLDKLRKTEFPQLKGGVYADWTGGAVPPNFLVQMHTDFLINNLLGNPHSEHMPSKFAMGEILSTRKAVLDYFRADPAEYEVVFTQNATTAILLLSHYLFDGGELLLTEDNHNSVNGLRQIAKRKGAVVHYSPMKADLSIDAESLERSLSNHRSTHNKLFCYPAKSNYSGVMHSLDWIKTAQDKGWDVLLDTAAYAANNRLDLSKVKPDFAPISFYKLFGYPTGIGCLLVKKEKYEKLNKMWFSGGSILLVGVGVDFYAPESLGYARFEDGTVNFAGIPAIKNGLQFMETLGNVKPRVVALASWLNDALSSINVNGNSVVVYNARGNDTVAFNIKKGDQVIDEWYFESAANKAGIYVRTGCFCNPGTNEKIFAYNMPMYQEFYNSVVRPEDLTVDNFRNVAHDKPVGSIRASFGYANDFSDVQRFAEFTRQYVANL